MSKELEALKRIKRESGIPYFSTLYDIDMWEEDFCIIETALKENQKLTEMLDNDEKLISELDKKNMLQEQVLKIIKEKSVNVYIFQHSGDLATYNDMVDSDDRKLTQAEFDLLKEVLV